MITICKVTLGGSTPEQIREQTRGLAPARLRDLAVQLAAQPDLTVSVIVYDDGTQELEVLHTGPPRHTEDTIDCQRFSDRTAQTPTRTLPIASQADVSDGMVAVRSILRAAAS